MNLFKKANIGTLIENVPGPSPWYLFKKEISTRAGIFKWVIFEIDEYSSISGISCLQTPSHKDIILLDHYCYVQPLNEDRILLWFEDTNRYDSGNIDSCYSYIQFEIFNIVSMASIDQPKTQASYIRKEKKHRFYVGEPASSFRFSTMIIPGLHVLENVPSEFSDLGEILVLANPLTRPNIGEMHMNLTILAFNFSNNQVEILPQDWYNFGNFDFGYEWVTRVVRNPQNGKIVGDGIRLGKFQLDNSGRRRE